MGRGGVYSERERGTGRGREVERVREREGEKGKETSPYLSSTPLFLFQKEQTY